MVEKVLIIGGGIGGLSTAIALGLAGIDVDLVEIKSEWKVYHVGIIVQGNFIRAIPLSEDTGYVLLVQA